MKAIPEPGDRPSAIDRFANRLDALRACDSFEVAAQRFCDEFYAEFAETALVRLFGTVPYDALGDRERRFVEAFAERVGVSDDVRTGAPILTLFGTRGIEAAWGRREASRDHLAIPLVSSAFVAEIPMISRLLAEFGFSHLAAGDAGWQFVSRADAGTDGLFFVGDARTTTDERGRLIIPNAEFVDRYRIRSVFGFGGPARGGAMLIGAIVFSRGIVARAQAAAFVPLVEKLRSVTADVLERMRLFAASS